ncbi:hypothetical protein ISTM_392 [Insectomime virus]|nr:hypothetical protein ISTM_392 [Insectomime virus]
MQALIIEAKRHLHHKRSDALEQALEVIETFTKDVPREEKEYAICRYNETLFLYNVDEEIKRELRSLCGFAPDWSHVSYLLEEEVLEEEWGIYEHLKNANAIWWETEEGMNYTFLPPRSLQSGDLQVRLFVSDGVCTIFDADGDAEVVDIENAHLVLSATCRQRNDYPLLSPAVEQLFASI